LVEIAAACVVVTVRLMYCEHASSVLDWALVQSVFSVIAGSVMTDWVVHCSPVVFPGFCAALVIALNIASLAVI